MEGPLTSDTRVTLRDLVLQRLRSNIVSGRNSPGVIFSVPALAEEIGVSTDPVREALLDLYRAGMVTPLRTRGFRVEPISLDHLNVLMALRELLECFATTAPIAPFTESW